MLPVMVAQHMILGVVTVAGLQWKIGHLLNNKYE
jgi:hypothetical protein